VNTQCLWLRYAAWQISSFIACPICKAKLKVAHCTILQCCPQTIICITHQQLSSLHLTLIRHSFQPQQVLDNPAPFLSPFSFEITFECLQPLTDDLEWKVLYVGSAEDTSHDQVLDEILVGPIPVGINKFVLQADAPDISAIPEGDVLGVTVVLVTCSYREKEFVRVGYYVNNEYSEPYDEEVGPPKPLDMSKVRRHVLAEKPRVTRFPISWGDEEVEEKENETAAESGEQMMEEAKVMMMGEGSNLSAGDGMVMEDETMIQ
jgi:histone chaperone ASF1